MKNILLILIVALGVGCRPSPRSHIKVFVPYVGDLIMTSDSPFSKKFIDSLQKISDSGKANSFDWMIYNGSKWSSVSGTLPIVKDTEGLTSSTSNDSLVYIVDTGLYAPNAHLSTTGGAIDAYMIYLDSIYGRWAMRDTMQIFGHAYDDDALNYIRACGADSILGKYNWRQLDNGDIEYFDKKWIKVVPRQQRGNAIMSIPGNDWPSPTYPLKGSENSGVQFYPIEIYTGKEWRTIPYDHYYDTAVIDDWYTYGRQQDRDSANYYMKQYIKKDTTKKHQP